MRARVLGLLYLLALASPALAEDRRAMPLDRLLPEIRRTTPGAFYDAEGPVPGPDGNLRYRLKWMTPEGRIVWFDVDARSGRVLGGFPVAPERRFPDNGFPGQNDRGWGGGQGWPHGGGPDRGRGHDRDRGRRPR
jgi:hypothetical protein